MKIGVKLGGVDGPNSLALVSALEKALMMAVELGQNSVAQTIATQLGGLGSVQGAMLQNCSVVDKSDSDE